ncbi:MAG TPA: DNA recombination protein RmuC [Candidatus Stercoripulliclostridium merdigallinarum]|uniref:DNA recombination protein RmuC n=1 Tax=Candidatus Stercoripulliclostridium merdigallinarum TaxID=2840951 RepID=A0A9D1MHG8_9FIRM|nr:DNA recombination protein RmuC [Candidatus Stercoripulliclostridium merdigallinarum]
MTTVIILSAVAAALSLVTIVTVAMAIRKIKSSGTADNSDKIVSEIKSGNSAIEATVRTYTVTQSGAIEKLTNQFSETAKKDRESANILHDRVLQSVKDQAANNEKRIAEMSDSQRAALAEMKKELKESLEKLGKDTREDMEKVRKENEEQLDRIRGTVDEKLTKTLNERLDSSFKNVSDTLDKLYRNLGELKSLDAAVGDLNKTLNGVKTRGNWGELSLETLLTDILTPDQYERQSSMGRRVKEMVDFAVKMPGSNGSEVYLPIDSKFPIEDFQRMMAAFDAGNMTEYNLCRKEFEKRLKSEAISIRNKYISPPKTTDFALMYLPTESLYAEALRIPGLVEEIQRNQRVIVTGPTNAAALLNSLRIGFRTLRIEKSSAEVFKILSDFRKKFDTFKETIAATGDLLNRARDKLQKAEDSTEKMDKSLRRAEGLDIDSEVQPPMLIGQENTGI